jgi:hypothetical protein
LLLPPNPQSLDHSHSQLLSQYLHGTASTLGGPAALVLRWFLDCPYVTSRLSLNRAANASNSGLIRSSGPDLLHASGGKLRCQHLLKRITGADVLAISIPLWLSRAFSGIPWRDISHPFAGGANSVRRAFLISTKTLSAAALESRYR